VARLLGFFLLVVAAFVVLQNVPLVGALFRIPFFGFWLALILVSVVLTKFGKVAYDRRKVRALERELGAVETPHNQGKLGVLHANRGNPRRAIPCLERAVAGEPEFTEWHYRLGISKLAVNDLAGARAALERVLALNEDHAYGEALLRLAEVTTRQGEGELALATIARFEEHRGPNPESAYRRGLALCLLGRKDEARAALQEVGAIANRQARYQRRSTTRWVMLAFTARARLALGLWRPACRRERRRSSRARASRARLAGAGISIGLAFAADALFGGQAGFGAQQGVPSVSGSRHASLLSRARPAGGAHAAGASVPRLAAAEAWRVFRQHASRRSTSSIPSACTR
jgi:tetratricopeptide (TPR) repeat protein